MLPPAHLCSHRAAWGMRCASEKFSPAMEVIRLYSSSDRLVFTEGTSIPTSTAGMLC